MCEILQEYDTVTRYWGDQDRPILAQLVEHRCTDFGEGMGLSRYRIGCILFPKNIEHVYVSENVDLDLIKLKRHIACV